MPDKKNRFADVTEKSKVKRAELDKKAAARKVASAKADVEHAASRTAREGNR